ncbi:MAG: CPBP family intramembrane metalloprotease [Leptolyngbyaceae cyanobacterium SL_7_1]|nr:CPBP family intramembrane metalloprotease [Leptolyngbyaceae cyanobacterium SL_7_1]
MHLLINRVINALLTQPTSLQWLQWLGVAELMAVTMIPLGYGLGFLQFRPVRSPQIILKVGAIALFTPALSEELCFRVFLLPHPTEALSPRLIGFWTVLSLIAFLLYHPLNALSFFPAGRKTFLDPVFLLLALILGVGCSIAYLNTGSLWLPTAIHWLAVVVWLLVLGGYERLYGEEGNSDY